MVEDQVAGEGRRGGDHDSHCGRNGSSGLVASGGEHGCLLSGARTEVENARGGGISGMGVEGLRYRGGGGFLASSVSFEANGLGAESTGGDKVNKGLAGLFGSARLGRLARFRAHACRCGWLAGEKLRGSWRLEAGGSSSPRRTKRGSCVLR